jgi:hypothetical protein
MISEQAALDIIAILEASQNTDLEISAEKIAEIFTREGIDGNPDQCLAVVKLWLSLSQKMPAYYFANTRAFVDYVVKNWPY